MNRRIIIAALALGALGVAGCGSSSSSSSTASASSSTTAAAGGASKTCAASVGFEGPITGPGGHARRRAAALRPARGLAGQRGQRTNITIVQGDTQLTPAQATTVTQQFISNSKIVAVVGPAGSQEVEAVGPLFGRAGMRVHHRLGDQRRR